MIYYFLAGILVCQLCQVAHQFWARMRVSHEDKALEQLAEQQPEPEQPQTLKMMLSGPSGSGLIEMDDELKEAVEHRDRLRRVIVLAHVRDEIKALESASMPGIIKIIDGQQS